MDLPIVLEKIRPVAEKIENERGISSSWPSGFISLVLTDIALSHKFVAYRLTDPELGAAIIEEIAVIANAFNLPINAVLADAEGWDLAVKPDLSNIIIASPDLKLVTSTIFYEFVTGDELPLEELIDALIDSGYRRVGSVAEPGEFALRGGILDIFPIGDTAPKRVEFFGDTIESIRIFDPLTQRSTAILKNGRFTVSLRDTGSNRLDAIEFHDKAVSDIEVVANSRYAGQFELFKSDIKRLLSTGYEVYMLSDDERRGRRLASLVGAKFHRGSVFQGFQMPSIKFAVFSDRELTGAQPKKRRISVLFGERIEDLTALQPGDIVVHIDYGIARYEGLETIEVENTVYDCLKLKFKDGYVYVPTYNLEVVQKFTSSSDSQIEPEITEIGSPRWLKRRARAMSASFEIASDLLRIHALRKARKGFAFSKDNELMMALEASFPYEETEDQKRVIEEVKRDMESERVMDRLVAGEVGFGKTEVAIRASFKAVLDGKQVAIVVPTTLLALQHYRSFTERLKNFPVRVAMVSRLVKSARIKEILQELKEGKIDIVIGTHRLLRDDVEFKDLGLLIIDEEHRFGVAQKEKLRKKYPLVDTLRLTATPIPRTLYAALGKIYDLSLITTPPIGRQSVETIVAEYSDSIVIEAIEREMKRHGQVFYVFNRIEGIEKVAERLRRFFPELNITVAHGRMKKSELEDIFIDFYEGKIDVLVSTSIIEAGVDFPRANTLIIENADRFGLAELHQLRGRVGRSIVKAYAYFLVPKTISEKAKRRLRALATYHQLGSGIKIALADMEIRGAGNLLGREQHGHINAVGVEMFFSMLEEAVRELSGQEPLKEPSVTIKGISALIPESYISEPDVRVSFYRRISNARNERQLNEIREELMDRFGRLPNEVENLLQITSYKLLAMEKGYDEIRVSEKTVEFIKGKEAKSIKRSLPIKTIKNLL